MISMVLFKIRDFLSIAPGWHYGEGIAPSEKIVNIAEQIAICLIVQGFPKLNAFPGRDGEIQVTAYLGKEYFEFTVENTGKITFIQESSGLEVACQENLDLVGCLKIIKDFAPLCDWYEQSIKNTMIQSWDDLQAWPSNPPLTAESPSLIVSAPCAAAEHFAATSASFMRKSAAHRPYFGFLTQVFCQPILRFRTA